MTATPTCSRSVRSEADDDSARELIAPRCTTCPWRSTWSISTTPTTATPCSSERTNPFNLQGLLWFARATCSPAVRKAQPTFELDAVGRNVRPWKARRRDRPRTAPSTTSPDVYRSSAFAICPLLAGTGEQVKIVDAMAHGLAVVATRRSASSSPIVDGVNGYVVDSAEEFADRVSSSGSDRALCRRRWATAARETVITERSQERTTASSSRSCS